MRHPLCWQTSTTTDDTERHRDAGADVLLRVDGNSDGGRLSHRPVRVVTGEFSLKLLKRRKDGRDGAADRRQVARRSGPDAAEVDAFVTMNQYIPEAGHASVDTQIR